MNSSNVAARRVARRPRRLTLIAALLLGVVLAGCGTTGSGNGSSNASGAPAGPISEKVIKSVQEFSVVPTKIIQSAALPAAPAPRKVGFVICGDPSCPIFAGYWDEITKSLGWQLVTVNATLDDPGAGIQQLLDAGVDYIGITGHDIAQYRSAMDEAQAKGVPVFACWGSDAPGGPANNLYSNCSDSKTYDVNGRALADWEIENSGGTANVLTVNLPSFSVLNTLAQAHDDEIAQYCPGCTTARLEPSVDDMSAGRVPNMIISHLQANPGVQYIMFTYSQLAVGVPEALRSAGLADQLKLTGAQPLKNQVQGIVDGTYSTWTNLPKEYGIWALADQMVRYSENQWSLENERSVSVPPMYYLSDASTASGMLAFEDGWPGPTGFKDQFKQLWKVG